MNWMAQIADSPHRPALEKSLKLRRAKARRAKSVARAIERSAATAGSIYRVKADGTRILVGVAK